MCASNTSWQHNGHPAAQTNASVQGLRERLSQALCRFGTAEQYLRHLSVLERDYPIKVGAGGAYGQGWQALPSRPLCQLVKPRRCIVQCHDMQAEQQQQGFPAHAKPSACAGYNSAKGSGMAGGAGLDNT
jgi:hypothetical protein